MEFEWDLKKARTNLHKHGVSFDEAKTVFDDVLACIFDDAWHSTGEKRELIIGHSSNELLLVISFTEREQGIIRIISARPTTYRERQNYEQHSKRAG